MKNIYNLLSDAFVSMNLDELEYEIKITYSNYLFPYYDILIKSRNPNAIGSASLNLILNFEHELIDYHPLNSLFTRNQWGRFQVPIESQIPALEEDEEWKLTETPLFFTDTNVICGSLQ